MIFWCIHCLHVVRYSLLLTFFVFSAACGYFSCFNTTRLRCLGQSVALFPWSLVAYSPCGCLSSFLRRSVLSRLLVWLLVWYVVPYHSGVSSSTLCYSSLSCPSSNVFTRLVLVSPIAYHICLSSTFVHHNDAYTILPWVLTRSSLFACTRNAALLRAFLHFVPRRSSVALCSNSSGQSPCPSLPPNPLSCDSVGCLSSGFV